MVFHQLDDDALPHISRTSRTKLVLLIPQFRFPRTLESVVAPRCAFHEPMVVQATHALSCGGARSEAGGVLLLVFSGIALNGVLLGTGIAWWHFHAYLPSLVLLTLQCSSGATLSRNRNDLLHVQFELGN